MKSKQVKPNSLYAAIFAALAFPFFLYCTYPVYDGDDRVLEEQQSVWQYLKTFSIYQERLPAECGNYWPADLFDMIHDTLKGGRYTGYDSDGGNSAIPSCSVFDDADSPDVDARDVNLSTVYVPIDGFTAEAWDQFEKLVPYMEGYQNIVIDLWNNGGGYLTTVENMLNELLPEGADYIEYRYRDYDSKTLKSRTVEWEKKRAANRRPRLAGKNIVVLMNGGSASASEIMAAALRDRAGARLVGERSYGKGIGQYVFSRTDRKTLRVTHMEIRGVSERTGDYHRIGIEPDEIPREYVDAMRPVSEAVALATARELRARIDNAPDAGCRHRYYDQLTVEYLYEVYYPYVLNLYCAIKTADPSYDGPPRMEKAARHGQSIDAALAPRALKRIVNPGAPPVGVYVIGEPDLLK